MTEYIKQHMHKISGWWIIIILVFQGYVIIYFFTKEYYNVVGIMHRGKGCTCGVYVRLTLNYVVVEFDSTIHQVWVKT